MPYDFDTVIDRRNTNSMKWDTAKQRGFPEDALPLWVADLDFQAPPKVMEAVRKVADHGVFGYTDMPDSYFTSVYNWFSKHHEFYPERDWMTFTPGVVFAVAAAINAFTKKGDGVLVQPPVYGPFSSVLAANERIIVENPLLSVDGHHYIDFDDLDDKLKLVKLMILCNPHNPGGRVYTKEELERIGAMCKKHNVIVLSDEIHCDFIFPGHKHIVFSNVNDECRDNCVICTAPSKTFNIAGMQLSNIFIPNKELNAKMRKAIAATSYEHPTICGIAAAKAAYDHGEEWLEALMKYLEANSRYAVDFINERVKGVTTVMPDSTFLLWLDFRGLNLPHDEVTKILLNEAKLWLDNGLKFGTQGEGFQRLNIGCPRSVLEYALGRMEETFAKYV